MTTRTAKAGDGGRSERPGPQARSAFAFRRRSVRSRRTRSAKTPPRHREVYGACRRTATGASPRAESLGAVPLVIAVGRVPDGGESTKSPRTRTERVPLDLPSRAVPAYDVLAVPRSGAQEQRSGSSANGGETAQSRVFWCRRYKIAACFCDRRAKLFPRRGT